MTMILYHWPAMESLKLYSHGDLIVMAESVEEARAKAVEFFDTRAKFIGYKDVEQLRQSVSEPAPSDAPADISYLWEDDKVELAELRELFIKDIAATPLEVDAGVVAVQGGE